MFLLVIALFALCKFEVKSKEVNNEPRVVLKECNRPVSALNLYWDTDFKKFKELDGSDCFNNYTDVLNFCRKVYPDKDIKNVVADIKSTQHRDLFFEPFRCLQVPYISEALLVPPNCRFMHLYDADRCLHQERWLQLAENNCTSLHMTLNGSSLLIDCDVSLFAGIEFVCCPLNSTTVNEHGFKSLPDNDSSVLQLPKSTELLVPVTNDDEDDPVDTSLSSNPPLPQVMGDANGASMGWELLNNEDEYTLDDEIEGENQTMIVKAQNEHNNFLAEKEKARHEFEEKSKKLNAEWRDAQRRIGVIMQRDPAYGRQLYNQLLRQFNRLNSDLKKESAIEQLRVDELHHSHVALFINELKEYYYQSLLNSLMNYPLNIQASVNAFVGYIRALHKERTHIVNRYESLTNMDSPFVMDKEIATVNDLKTVNKSMDDAFKLISNYPIVREMSRAKLEDVMDEYKEVTNEANLLIEMLSSSTHTYGKAETSKVVSPTLATTKSPPKNNRFIFSAHKIYRWTPITNFKDSHLGWSFFILIVVVIGIILFTLVIYYRSHINIRFPCSFKRKFCVVNTYTPEERLLAKMQINGYENPTYKFFETQIYSP